MSIDFERLKANTDLPTLIGQTVALKKKGRVHMARCPFHTEKSPSFVVYPTRYHCFGCGETGDAVDWIRKAFGVDTVQAVSILGGHSTFDPQKPVLVKRERAVDQYVDPAPALTAWAAATSLDMVREHAIELGVATAPLLWLKASYAKSQKAWAFPQRDGRGNIIGARFRNTKGEKWSFAGGRAGLFLPDCDPLETLYIAEGPTDTAALLTMGLFAIGRSSCLGQEDMVLDYIRINKVRRAVIVSDNDTAKKRANGEAFYPGIEGATILQEKLKVPSCIWIPEAKDVREWLGYGGTVSLIESNIKNLIWTNPK